MKKQIRPYFIFLLFSIAILETLFMGCGSGGGGGNPSGVTSSSTEESIVYTTPSTLASNNGTFFLSSIHSNFSAKGLTENTLKKGSSITLTEREPKSNESKLYGSDCTRIYRLVATYDSSGLNTVKKINKVDKPITITIENPFPSDSQEFYIGVRSSSEADWQYSKLENTFDKTYFISLGRASANENPNYTFNIETYNLDEEFAIFRAPPSAAPEIPKAPLTPSTLTFANMSFSVQLPYLDLMFNENNEVAYNTDLVVNTCVTSNSSNYTDCKVKTIITFLTDSNQIIEDLDVVGNITKTSEQTVSSELDGGGTQYTHTITFNDYPIPQISNKVATYTFTLKMRNILLSQFPNNFRIKSIISDNNSNTFTKEENITQDKVLSYLKAVSPTQNLTSVATDTTLVMKYIAHDVASLSVVYTYGEVATSAVMTGSFSKDESHDQLVFTPDFSWPEGEYITASVTAFCCNAHKENGKRATEFNFTTVKASETQPIPATYTDISVSMVKPEPIIDVATNTSIVLAFSERIKWKDSYKSVIKFNSTKKQLEINEPVFDSDANLLTFYPKLPLDYNATYTVTFNKLTDSYYKRIIPTTKFSFKTGDGIHTTASITGSDSLIIDNLYTTLPKFKINFGKSVSNLHPADNYKINLALDSIKVYQDNELVNSDNFTKSWIASYSVLELAFKYPLDSGKTYKIKMSKGVLDFEGLEITPFDIFYFTTLPEITASMTIPEVTTDVATNTKIAIQFSDDVNWVEGLSDWFNLYEGKNEINIDSYTYNSSNQTLTMIPQKNLRYHATYTVEIDKNLKDPVTKQPIVKNSFNFNTLSMAEIDDWEPGQTIYTDIDFTTTIRFPLTRVKNQNVARNSVKLMKGETEIAPASYTWISEAEFPNVLILTYRLEPSTTYILKMLPVEAMDGRMISPFPQSTVITNSYITSSITTPSSSTEVATNTEIVFTFSDDIAWLSTPDYKRFFEFYRGYNDITSDLQDFYYNSNLKTLTITPKPLYYNASYTIKLIDGLINPETKQKVTAASFTFTTKDDVHFTPTVALATDSNVDGLAILIPTICIDFQQPVMNISLAERALELYRGDTLMTGYKKRWANDLSKLEIYYTATLVPSAEHTLKMINSIKDATGREIRPFADFKFTTLPNITPSLIVPAGSYADIDTTLVLKFSDSISWKESSDADKIQFRQNLQDLPIESYVYSESEKTLTLTPSSPLLHNASYTIKILDDLVNDTTRQQVATLSFTIYTSDGIHQQATITIAPESEVNSRAILKPIFTIDLKKAILSSQMKNAFNYIKVYKGGTEVTSVSKSWKDNYSKLNLSFSVPLEHDQTYRIVMEEGLRDYEGIYIDPFADYEFTTLDYITVSLSSPSPTTGVDPTTPIILSFSDPIDWASSYDSYITLRTGGNKLPLNSSEYNETSKTLTINPGTTILHNETYELIIRNGIKNNTTYQTTRDAAFEFSTTSGANSNAVLTLYDYDAVDDLYVVSPTFYVDFVNEVKDRNLASEAIKLYNSDNQEFLSLVKTWTTKNKKLTLTCSTNLKPNTTYTLLMNDGVKAKDGSNILPFTKFIFTTTPNGNGSKSDPFIIYNASQVDGMRNRPYSYYKLDRDIDISYSSYKAKNNTETEGWLPVGDSENPFGGGLDGNGKKITGLFINRTNIDSVGLFGQLDGATIENVYVSDGSVTGQDSCGGIAGYAYNSTFTKCRNENVSVSGTTYVGGICGSVYSTTMIKCLNKGTVTSSNDRIGGITGWTKNVSRIISCSNSGSVTGLTTDVGGITGFNNGTVENSFNDGIIKGLSSVGGISGSNNVGGKIDRCISIGNISATNIADGTCGGICGYNEGTATISNSFITNSTSVNGYICYNQEQLVGNFVDTENKNMNYFFDSYLDINLAITAAANWTDFEVWDRTIWALSNTALPSLIDMP